MGFCFFPDKPSSLPVVYGVTQIINSYAAVNIRALFILGVLLFIHVYILALACRECFIKSLSKS